MPTPTTIKITDYDDRTIARMPGYQQEATNYVKLLKALMTEAQALEDALDDIENKRHLTVAVGEQLDELGTILDLKREGKPDSDYRAALLGRAASLAGSGEGDRLIDAYLFLTQANSIGMSEHQPATAQLDAHVTLDSFSAAEDAAIIDAIDETKAQGVDLILLVVEDVAATGLAFLWGDSADADASGDLLNDADHGWGDSADADVNGDITQGLGKGGNIARIMT